MLDWIFVDMDGVVADFTGPVSKLHNKEPYPPKNIELPAPYFMEETWGMSKEEFLAPTRNVEFWATLPPFSWTFDLMRFLETVVDPEKIVFLTSGYGSFARAGKQLWIKEHFPAYKSRFIFTPYKQAISRSNCLLIDDWDKHIDDWRSNQGIGMLFPQLWNRAWKYSIDPLGVLMEEIECL